MDDFAASGVDDFPSSGVSSDARDFQDCDTSVCFDILHQFYV